VSESVYQRMNAEREKEAREHRSEGRELAEGIQAAADREVTVIRAEAYRDAEQIRGDGDAEATRTYADAFNQDPEFYSFTRSLRAYQDAFQNGGDILAATGQRVFPLSEGSQGREISSRHPRAMSSPPYVIPAQAGIHTNRFPPARE